MKDFKVKPRLVFTEGRERFDCPEGVTECSEVLDGVVRTWKEYIPSGYTGETPVPLVFTLHGGSTRRGSDHHHAELTNAWAMVGERENFIVVYPQSLTPEHTWSAWEDFTDTERTAGLKDDIRYLDLLLDRIREKYRIDETRMYLHGQSFGDVMSTFYLLNRPGHPFAAAATLSGPVGAEKLFGPDGECRFGREVATPVVRTHGSLDMGMPFGNFHHMEDTVLTFDLMREGKARGESPEQIQEWKFELQMLPLIETWRQCNGCQELPRLSVRGRYNALTWPGDPDFSFYVVENGGHGPSMDMADFIWSSFFSAWQKVDGAYLRCEPMVPFTPDEGAVALVEGGATAYVNQKPVSLRRPVRCIEDAFYVTVEDARRIFPELSFTSEEEGYSVVIAGRGHEMQLSASNRTFVFDDRLCHGERTRWDDEMAELLLPIAQIAGYFCGMEESRGHGVCYLSWLPGEISYDFSRLVRMLLGVERFPTGQEMYDRIMEILKDAPQPGLK